MKQKTAGLPDRCFLRRSGNLSKSVQVYLIKLSGCFDIYAQLDNILEKMSRKAQRRAWILK